MSHALPSRLSLRFFSASIALFLSVTVSASTPAAKISGEPGSISNTPPDMTYFALEGDTLSSIALRYTDKTSNATLLGKRNKISNDRTIPIGSAIVIPLELLPEEASQAKVVALAGQVTTKNKNGIETALSLGDMLYEYSVITTAKNGFLSLALPDESRISIPSNSQVLLAKLRMLKYTKSPRTEVRLQQGRVESRVSTLVSNKGRFEVTSPLAIAGVRGTHFRVGINDNGIASEVLSGAVAVGKITKPNALLLASGQGNIINQAGLGKAASLFAAPTLENGYQLQEKPTVQLAVSKMEQARGYRVQIATDAQAQNIIAEGRIVDTAYKVDGLIDGNYFSRVTAFDAAGLEGLPAVFPFTLKARPEPPFTVAPKAKLRAESVNFAWTEATDALGYRLQLASDAEFKQILIDQSEIKATQYTASKLPHAKYFWRIATLAQKNGKLDQGPYSDTQTFSFMPAQAMNPVTDTGANALSLNWPSEPGQSFLLEIASDASFSALYLSQQLSQPEISIPRPPSGLYFIRVKATDADGYVGAYSATQKVEIFTRWVSGNGEPIDIGGTVARPNF
ncbi:FecR domain-containing protein [Undibacterium parvum]|uniref:LysM peptidoglycan-binding domain-containing protein n=1 Tax=Undibacterium parvum TaxID=401471 RepID=A0A3Q9BSJ9_9BURK|nr:FecR domain-containing protein [Undibacterium parvum]AZP12724.1 LysM peptidoglycan-binding domain-containing protein [Undibacterium parvum]